MPGILDQPLLETPIAVLDFETTGLSPGWDRALELAIVRLDPGEPPRLVFDTLIHPGRPVAASFIHGITDADVANAPPFSHIAGDVVRALSGCVVAAYNAAFDMRFLRYELGESGFRQMPPYFCAMYLRPMLGLGRRCGLAQACQAHEIDLAQHHTAATDTLATAALVRLGWQQLPGLGLMTFADLARRRRYRFIQTWRADPLHREEALHLPACHRLCSRYARTVTPLPRGSWRAVPRQVQG